MRRLNNKLVVVEHHMSLSTSSNWGSAARVNKYPGNWKSFISDMNKGTVTPEIIKCILIFDPEAIRREAQWGEITIWW